MKIARQVIFGLTVALFTSCGIKSYRTFGDDFEEILVFSDQNFKCEFSQVISDVSSDANIYLNFYPKTNDTTEITDLQISYMWQQDGKIISPSGYQTKFEVKLFKKEGETEEATTSSFAETPPKFKIVVDKNNRLLYVVEYYNPLTYSFPKNVEKMIFEIEANVKTKGKIQKIKKTIKLNENKHHYFWFLRDC